MKTGGHIKPCKVGSVEEHNERRQEYVERMKQSKHPLNFYPTLALRPNFNSYNREREEYRDKSTGKPLTVAQVFNRMIDVYTEKDKRHRRPPLKDRERFDPKTGKVKTIAGWSPIREMVVVIKPDTKPEDFDKVKAWFRKHGVETMFLSLHFDEGHLKNGNLQANNHAHMGLDFFDWETGKTNKLGPKKMKELQDVLADALGMERGEIKEVTGADHMDVPEYREVAEAIEEKKEELADLDGQVVLKHQEVAELDATIDQKQRKANSAKADIWGAASSIAKGAASLIGVDKTVSDLRKEVKQLREELAAERKAHKATKDGIPGIVKKSVEKAFQSLFQRILSITGQKVFVGTLNENQVIHAVNDLKESRDSSDRAWKILHDREVAREKSQNQAVDQQQHTKIGR